ncbi:septum formation initiator family protein [Tessaracoccus sp. OS52]|uniref:FtsB family cell division protein n=1 Tax=Tessaracoccus sp. OS52 TaxID=2886691 RepID=UPI001D11AC61|nr:septum formation initiator family protein [Tessaracoccus sp. OS52]MCC2593587.1 septum formation initiator family protein [Tessaracoccus sp. OS52]
MARVSRNKPTSTGPGSGSPRSRTAARPGERAASQRSRTRAVAPPEPEDDAAAAAPPRAMASRALGLTWRLLVLGVVVAAIAVTLAQSLRVYFVQTDQIAELRAEIEGRQAQIDELEDQLSRWEDPAFVEAQARERLGWVFPGEVGYRVIGPDGEPIGGESDVLGVDETEEPPALWWEKMWGSVAVADQPLPEPTAEPEPSADVTIGVSPQPSPSSTE